MKAFACVVLLAAAALSAPAPEGARDKRSFLHHDHHDFHHLDSYISSPIISHHSPIISHSFSEPIIAHSSHIVSEPAIVSVKKIVEVPKVVALKKIVTVPHVVSYPRFSSISYAPSYHSGWW